MSIVNITGVSYTDDGYLTRRGTANALETYNEYVLPLEQDYISVKNNGSYDITLNVGRYDNKIIHPTETWEADIDFTSFTIKADDTTAFAWIAKEYDTTPVLIDSLWDKMALRDKADSGDMLIITTAATSSAAAMNTAIGGEAEVFNRTVDIELQNTATDVHTWFNGAFPITITVTSTAGVVTTAHEYVTFAAGLASLVLTHTGVWVEADTVVLALTAKSFYGYEVATASSTDTIAA